MITFLTKIHGVENEEFKPSNASKFGYITHLTLNIANNAAAYRAQPQLTDILDNFLYRVMNCEAMMPELIEMKALKDSSGTITLLILYLLVSFGIFGVILMMTKERQQEFGILLSIGMKRRQLALVIWLETIFLGLLGATAGILLSYGLMYYLSINPIEVTGDMAETYAKFGIEPKLPASIDADIFYKQGFIVLLVTTLLAFYPCISIWRMRPVEGLRG